MVEEKDLVRRVLAGHADAFGVLVQQYQRLVYHLVRRVVDQEQDVEDVCQEVFLKVHRHLASFAFEAKLSTWIARIAYLTAINYARQYRRVQLVELSDADGAAREAPTTPLQALETLDTATYLTQLVNQLPPLSRTIITLYHLEEFSYQEIGQITQLPEGTVKSYLFRARKQLKAKLELYLKHEQR
jgi:RNA polymerase sigma-70 factor (ECF subfamily)